MLQSQVSGRNIPKKRKQTAKMLPQNQLSGEKPPFGAEFESQRQLQTTNLLLNIEIERLQKENTELKHQNALLQQKVADLFKQLELRDKKIQELEKIIARLQNTNVPPSIQHSPFGPHQKRNSARTEQKQLSKKHQKPGRPTGTKGTPHPQRQPDKIITLELDQCTHCSHVLTSNDIISIRSRIIEDIPEPPPKTVIEYKTPVYYCPECQQECTKTDPRTSQQGYFGPYVYTKTVMDSIVRRLPLRKVSEVFQDDWSLSVSPATILTILNRVATSFEDLYQRLLTEVLQLPLVHIDETSFSVNGKNWWVWDFTSPQLCVYVIHPSRGQTTLKKVIGTSFSGTVTSDRWNAYSSELLPFPHLQFCWAHLIRKFEDSVTEGQEAEKFLPEIRQLYHTVKESLTEDPPPEKREKLWLEAEETLQELINRYTIREDSRSGQVPSKFQKALEYLVNGCPYWFTFILIPGAEPTNNRAERDLREIVIFRKIKECFRSFKSVHTLEVLSSVLKTARLQGFPIEDYIYKSITGQVYT